MTGGMKGIFSLFKNSVMTDQYVFWCYNRIFKLRTQLSEMLIICLSFDEVTSPYHNLLGIISLGKF